MISDLIFLSSEPFPLSPNPSHILGFETGAHIPCYDPDINLPTMEEFSTVFYTYTFQLHISCTNKKTTTVCIKNLSQDTKKFLKWQTCTILLKGNSKIVLYWEHIRVVTEVLKAHSCRCKQTYLSVSTTPPTLSILQFNLSAAINLESSLKIK